MDETPQLGSGSAPANFVWCELLTTDPAAATGFYRAVVGWEAEDAGMGGPAYTVLRAGEVRVGGVMAMPPGPGAPPHPCWTGYLGVADVDRAAARVQAAGGGLRRPAEDIPGVGRFAVVADPQGGVVILFHPTGAEAAPQVMAGAPGRVGWHELHATDCVRAFEFYAGLFGWTRAEAFDMGAMGSYQIFAAGGVSIGGMMNSPAAGAGAFWLHYFTVEDIDAALARLTAAGGSLVMGPMEVPGGIWILQARDPQGAMFALVGPRG